MPLSTRLFHPRYSLLIILAAALLIGLTIAYWDYTQDDVFITFVYSRHIAEGTGFVFNPGERVQGTTTPLYALVMAGIYWLTHDLLHAGNVISAVCLGLTTAQAVVLLRRAVARPTLWSLVLLLVSAPLAYISFGMETLLYCALLLLALGLWAQDRRVLAMLAAAALTWTRADGLVMGVALGAAAVVDWLRSRTTAPGGTSRSSRPILHEIVLLVAVYLLGIAPWFLFAQVYFGSALPQTFSAKQELLEGTQFLSDGAQWWRTLYHHTLSGPLAAVAIPLIVVGAASAMHQRRLRAAVLWALGYTLGYTALNVTAFWYYTPLFVVLVILAVLGGDRLAQWAIRRGTSPRLVLVGALVVVGCTVVIGIMRAWAYREPPARMATYTLAGQWIDDHTDPTATLMLKDLGIVGYYARRTTLDSFGLIVPEMYDISDSYANAKYKTDYTLTTQYWEMQRLVAMDWFNYHFVPVAGFATVDDTEFSPMFLYRRRLALTPPPQAVQGTDLPLTCTLDLPGGTALPAETSARLLDSTGVVITEAAHPFLWDQYPGERTLGHETLIEQIALPLDVSPGVYTWVLECDQTLSGQVEVLPVTGTISYTPLDHARWNDFAQLVGIAAPEGLSTWSGGSVALLLHWEALGSANTDYSLFMHLVDSAGNVWAQTDGYPRDGVRPTSTWSAGDTIIDPRRIVLPPDLPAGDYTLVIGWYDWRTGDRVQLADGTGDALPMPLVVTNRWPGGSGRVQP